VLEISDKAWGKSKNMFYNADADMEDDEDACMCGESFLPYANFLFLFL